MGPKRSASKYPELKLVKRSKPTASLSRKRVVARTRPSNALHQPVSGVELKTVDTLAQGTAPVPAAGTLILLNGCAQGTDYTNRIGRKTVNRSVYLRASLFPITSAASPVGELVRIMCFMDKQPSGSAPAVADVLTSAAVESPQNLNNRDRFVTIFDEVVTLGATNYTAGNISGGMTEPKFRTWYKQIQCETIWGNTGATIASIESNAIYLLLLSDSGDCNMQWSARVRFEDE